MNRPLSRLPSLLVSSLTLGNAATLRQASLPFAFNVSLPTEKRMHHACLTDAFTLPDNFRMELPGPVFAHSTVESANGRVVACKETGFT